MQIRALRQQTPTLTPGAGSFLSDYLPLIPDLLEPRLWNKYTRITLVSNDDRERVTLPVLIIYYDEPRAVRPLPSLPQPSRQHAQS